MRHLVAAGGLAIAACTCGLLLAGAASARKAAGDTITVTGAVTGTTPSGTNIEFTAAGTPFKSIAFDGGSNDDFVAAASPGWTCNLTPTNGGVFCNSPTAATSQTINTTISGTSPATVPGTVAYGDGGTGTFSAPVSAASEACHCLKLSAELTGFKEEGHGDKLVFFLKWRLDCSSGTLSQCVGVIKLEHPPELPHGLEVQLHGRQWHHGRRELHCQPDDTSTCAKGSGELPFALVGHPIHRENRTIRFYVDLHCQANTFETFTLKFDGDGKLERNKSHLGNLN